MKIPIFVSAPTVLSTAQDNSRRFILREIERIGFEWRALGRSDYPTELPLREVLIIAQHCAGGVILGFSQFRADTGVYKLGTIEEKTITQPTHFATPWNQLEAGILFALRLPLLIFKEGNISGGVFDNGVTDVFIHPIPLPPVNPQAKEALQAVFLKWQASVRNNYYKL